MTKGGPGVQMPIFAAGVFTLPMKMALASGRFYGLANRFF